MRRRQFITGAGGLILFGGAAKAEEEAAPANPSTACYTTRQVTPGPYLLPDSPERSDIREGLPGMPLKLTVRVVDDIWCKPVEGAIVDIWHCDAVGRYSGVENLTFDEQSLRVTGVGLDLRGKQFMRGHQVTGPGGEVDFVTVFPGWYVPRLPHIHVRVVYRDVLWTALSTQLFFPAEIERDVFASGVYASRGPNPISAERDIVIKGDKQRLELLTVDLARDGEGFAGAFEVAATAL